jgi:hypothetical protein
MTTGARTWTRVLLTAIAAGFALVGGWAQLFPRSFYDDFPGAGHHWVAVDGPFNEHLVRDVGGLNLGLALLTAIAAITLARALVLGASGATLLYGVPHIGYHAAHLDKYGTTDQVGNIAALSLDLLLPVAVIALALPRLRAATGSSESA